MSHITDLAMAADKYAFEHVEHDMDTVMRHFADGFKPGRGRQIMSVEWFIDPFKGRVLFKVFVKRKD
jgi:Na+-transporting NADH:ubiquinone oxidoreductase subunit NqrC